MEFQGFSPETVDFLWGLRFNNNREWFEPHKEQYKNSLYEPMKALAAEVYAPVARAFPELECKVSRIYRDARLHPPTPYKESLWFCFRTAERPWGEQPVLFFELRPEGYSFGFLFWFAKTWQMEQLRKQLLADPEPFLKLVGGLEAGGLPLNSETYRRPKPCDDPRLTRFFAMKNLAAFVERSTDERLFSRELADEISECFEKCYPLLRYCRRVML